MGNFLGGLSMATKLTFMCKKRISEWCGGGESLREASEHEYEEAASRAVFSVVGMTCSACAGSVEEAIKRLPGIHEAAIDVLNNRAQVLFYASLVNEEKIRETIEAAGFNVSLIEDERIRQVSKISLKIDGEFTDESMKIIERSLKAVHGVQNVEINHASAKISVSYSPDATGPRNFIRVIESTVFGNNDHMKATIFSEGVVGRDSQNQGC